jgi:hypothetical protein
MGLMDKVKEGAKQAKDKAQQGVKAGQEKLEDSKLRKKINEWKEEIGGLVYAQRTGAGTPDADAEIDRLVGEITAAEHEIENNTASESSESDAETPPATGGDSAS